MLFFGMQKQLKDNWTNWVALLIAFIMPLSFYGNVFWGKSFGFDCAPAVMGNYPPYQQQLSWPNQYCATILDPGAYVWAQPAEWTEATRSLWNGKLAIWSQNVGLGVPLLANFQSNVLYLPLIPFSAMFALTKNLIYMDLFFVLRYMIASLGMYLFIRSFKLSKLLAWMGSLAFFSAGYFIVIPNISHHNVDILLPWVAWAINNFYFTKEKKWLGIGGFILGLSMLGGMPESSIFVLFFVGIYLIFLTLFFTNQNGWKYFFEGVMIVALGLGISAIVYLPGLEFIANGASMHHGGGNQKFVDWQNILFFFVPNIFAGTYGYQYVNKLNFVVSSWNYLGTTFFYIYLLVIVFIKDLWNRIKVQSNLKLLFFFWILTMILLLQQYGLVHFFFFENLPVFRETQFTKYSSSLINFSMITAVLLFLEYFKEKREMRVLFVGLIVVVLLFYINHFYHDAIFANQFLKLYFGFISANVLYALIVVVVVSLTLAFVGQKNIKWLIIFLLTALEFYAYFPREGDQQRRDSFRTPPAFNFLLNKNYSEFRIFGLDNILFPDLAMVYDLNDMRLLDALWINRHFQYMKNFFAEPDAFRITGIKENSASKKANIVNNNFFDLMSIKYLPAYNSIESIVLDNPIIDEIVGKNKNNKLVSKTIFDISKDSKNVLFEHAPGDIRSTITKPTGAKFLYLYPAMSPNLFNTGKGNGVKFKAEIYKDNKLIKTDFIEEDPANVKEDQKWFEMKLGPFPNPEMFYSFELRLITDPRGDNAYDWSGWGGFIWDTESNKTIEKYKLVYDDEMRIYENTDFVPRIHFVKNKMCLNKYGLENKYEFVVNKMKELRGEIKDWAIVDGSDCNVSSYNSSQVKINEEKFDDENISFEYSSPSVQYGVLSDAYYPGWNIYINGKRGTIDSANLAFRGFELPAGNNVQVEINYEPIVFRIGVAISIVSIVISIVIIMKNGRKKSQSKTEK